MEETNSAFLSIDVELCERNQDDQKSLGFPYSQQHVHLGQLCAGVRWRSEEEPELRRGPHCAEEPGRSHPSREYSGDQQIRFENAEIAPETRRGRGRVSIVQFRYGPSLCALL
jgi:hypothetical protein